MIIEICSQSAVKTEHSKKLLICAPENRFRSFQSYPRMRKTCNDKGTVLLTTFASKVVRRTVPLSTFLSSAMIYEEHKKGACAGRLRTGSRPGP